MGYRSDVLLAITFSKKEHRDEVLAIYAMHEFVKQYDLVNQWHTHDREDEDRGYFTLWTQHTNVKWYESYEDVQGYEHITQVAADFAEHRAFPYAYVKYRIGEEDNDIETDWVDDDEDGYLRDHLYDMCGITREINNGFDY